MTLRWHVQYVYDESETFPFSYKFGGHWCGIEWTRAGKGLEALVKAGWIEQIYSPSGPRSKWVYGFGPSAFTREISL